MDWLALFFNSFWIVGAAILLAATSFHHWLAGQKNRSLRDQLRTPSYSLWFWISFIFICIGLAGTSSRVWETAVWIIFGVASIVNAYRARVESRSQ